MPWTPAPPQLVMAYSVCKGITRTAAKNFYYAFMVLPRRKREALCAVYAFMRRCDDITDDATLASRAPPETRHLARRPAPRPARRAHRRPHPACPDRCSTPLHHSRGLARRTRPRHCDGCGAGRILRANQQRPRPDHSVQDFRRPPPLLLSRRVGRGPGLHSRFWISRSRGGRSLAERCGLAFQLTNIIRDVKEDAAMGRDLSARRGPGEVQPIRRGIAGDAGSSALPPIAGTRSRSRPRVLCRRAKS